MSTVLAKHPKSLKALIFFFHSSWSQTGKEDRQALVDWLEDRADNIAVLALDGSPNDRPQEKLANVIYLGHPGHINDVDWCDEMEGDRLSVWELACRALTERQRKREHYKLSSS
jgi:hypothetical protein